MEKRPYDLQYRQGTSGNFTDGRPQDVTGTSAAIGSLTPITSYEVQVRATNAEGDGDWSFSGTGQTSASPGGGTDPPGGGGGGGDPDDTTPGANNFPTADAGPDQSGVWEGALVMLDGSGSSHPEDEPLRYRWNQLSGEPVALSSQNVVNPTFTAPQGLTADEVLSFRLQAFGLPSSASSVCLVLLSSASTRCASTALSCRPVICGCSKHSLRSWKPRNTRKSPDA